MFNAHVSLNGNDILIYIYKHVKLRWYEMVCQVTNTKIIFPTHTIATKGACIFHRYPYMRTLLPEAGISGRDK